ncbi:MAG: family 20 glycosylhydrolase [Rikenellaceae bacterium]
MLKIETPKQGDANPEAYKLSIEESQITITATDYAGVLYGVESLRQLLPREVELSDGTATNLAVSCQTIVDEPHFKWRGMMLDVSRHFYDVSEIKKFLDMLAYYKLNKFHWHLTDDQGWRIEIKKYPLLTQNGAFRKFNAHDKGCIARAESGENKDFELDPAKIQVSASGDSTYGGFYTQEDIKEIVRYASERNIDIIPEVDMPGHCLSAIENYKGVSCTDNIGWGTLFSSPICPGKESALEFCRNVYAEIFELFPYEYVHLGADEVATENWTKCPDCQRRIKENNLKDEHELHSWFVRTMEQFFNDNNRKLIGWDEIQDGGLSPTATVMWWRSWVANSVHDATAQGNDAVLSPNFNMYLDYEQDKNSLVNIYDYNPILEGLSAEQAEHVLGVQANLWCEWVPSLKRAEYMTFPRLSALAEVAWCAPSVRDYDRFIGKLVRDLERLDLMGINYRPLDVVNFKSAYAFTEPSELTLSTPQPNIDMRYTTDGSTPTLSSEKLGGAVKFDQTTDIKIRMFRPDHSAADIIDTKVVIEPYAVASQGVTISGSGLDCRWYDYGGESCAKITTAPFNSAFVTDDVVIPDGVKGNIGLIFEGYLEVAKDGIYTFLLLSDDGSKMFINSELVLDNGGPHAPVEVVVQKALSAGLHPIMFQYFDHNGGKLQLRVADKDDNLLTLGKDYSFFRGEKR